MYGACMMTLNDVSCFAGVCVSVSDVHLRVMVSVMGCLCDGDYV